MPAARSTHWQLTAALVPVLMFSFGCGKRVERESPGAKLDRLLSANRLDEAEKFCRELVKKRDSDVLIHRGNLARVLCLRGEARLEALGFFDPDPVKARAAKGKTGYLDALARFRDAASECRAVLRELRSEREQQAFAKVRGTLGLALYRQGKTREAISELKRAVADDPKLAAAHNTLGLIFHELGKSEAAVANFKAALQADPGLAEAAYNLGVYFEDEVAELARIETEAREAGSRPPKGTASKKVTARNQAVKYYRRFLREQAGKGRRKQEVRRRIQKLAAPAGNVSELPGNTSRAA